MSGRAVHGAGFAPGVAVGAAQQVRRYVSPAAHKVSLFFEEIAADKFFARINKKPT